MLVHGRSYRLFEQGKEFELWAKICGVAYPLELGDRQLELVRRAKKIVRQSFSREMKSGS